MFQDRIKFEYQNADKLNKNEFEINSICGHS